MKRYLVQFNEKRLSIIEAKNIVDFYEEMKTSSNFSSEYPVKIDILLIEDIEDMNKNNKENAIKLLLKCHHYMTNWENIIEDFRVDDSNIKDEIDFCINEIEDFLISKK